MRVIERKINKIKRGMFLALKNSVIIVLSKEDTYA